MTEILEAYSDYVPPCNARAVVEDLLCPFHRNSSAVSGASF
jgi:hypothetical protein